jgi:Zn-dependent M28 family amino/carboxypeptidase
MVTERKRMSMQIVVSSIRIVLAVAVATLGLWLLIAQPTRRRNVRSTLAVPESRLRAHVEMLSRTLHPRDAWSMPNQDRCASYIEQHFKAAGAATTMQEFTVEGRTYRNVIGRIGSGPRKIVVGAHYDAVMGTPGADDNASGVAGLIEVACALAGSPPDKTVELVAYTLEEPPYFRTRNMGSAVHAERLAAERNNVDGVIVLEMIGYYSDAPRSQSYPVLLLRLMYPGAGNFVSVVGNSFQPGFAKKVKVAMKGATDLPVYSINAPRFLPGIDLSDHRNYWRHGFDAVMITDTAFYRNKAYHTAEDTADRLDYPRMAQCVVAVCEAVRSL